MGKKDKKEFNYYLLRIKRFMAVFLSCAICVILYAIFGEIPTAYAQVEGGSDFKDIEGCFYSMTPSTYGSLTTTVDGSQKYCYTLVDEGSTNSNYKYLTDSTGEVYAFEYYTYLENNALPTNRVAVYSRLNTLKAKTLSDGTIAYQDTTKDGLLYKTVADYLYYYLRKYTPSWQDTNTTVFSSTGLVSKANGTNSYFAYEPVSDDIWNEYQNIDVYTKYVFELNDKSIYYTGVKYDDETDTVVLTGGDADGKLDGSVHQIIRAEDTDVVTYVLQQQGDAYSLTDVNGRKYGESGFSTSTYYKGNQVFVYDSNIKTSDTSGVKTIQGFRIYSITNEKKTFNDLKDYTASDGYSLITLKSGSPIIEAIRYYSLYETTYEFVQQETNSEKVNNISQDEIKYQTSANVEFDYDNNGTPTSYDVTYKYTFEYYTGSTYTVTYKIMKHEIPYTKYTQNRTQTYSLKVSEDRTRTASGENLATSGDFSTYPSNTKFYQYLETITENNDQGTHQYSYADGVKSTDDGGIKVEDFTYANSFSYLKNNNKLQINGFKTATSTKTSTDASGLQYWTNSSEVVTSLVRKSTYSTPKFPNGEGTGTLYYNNATNNVYEYNDNFYAGYTSFSVYQNTTYTATQVEYETKKTDTSEFWSSSSTTPSNDIATISTSTAVNTKTTSTVYEATAERTGRTDVYTIKISSTRKKVSKYDWDDIESSCGWLFSTNFTQSISGTSWGSENGTFKKVRNYGLRRTGDTIQSAVDDALSQLGTNTSYGSYTYRQNPKLEGDKWRKANKSASEYNGDWGNYLVFWDQVTVTITKTSNRTIYNDSGCYYWRWYMNSDYTDNIKISTSDINSVGTWYYMKNTPLGNTYTYKYKKTVYTTIITKKNTLNNLGESTWNNISESSTIPKSDLTKECSEKTVYYNKTSTKNYQTQYRYIKPITVVVAKELDLTLDKSTIKMSYGSSTPLIEEGQADEKSACIKNIANRMNGTFQFDASSFKKPAGATSTTTPTLTRSLDNIFTSGSGGVAFPARFAITVTVYAEGLSFTASANIRRNTHTISDTIPQEEHAYYRIYEFDQYGVYSTWQRDDSKTKTGVEYSELNDDGTDKTIYTSTSRGEVGSIINTSFQNLTVMHKYWQRELTIYDYNNARYVENGSTYVKTQSSPNHESGINSTKYVLSSSKENKYYTPVAFEETVQKQSTNGNLGSNYYGQFMSKRGYDVNKAKNVNITVKNVRALYSGSLHQYKFVVQEVKNTIANGSSSANFGTNNVTVNSYYTSSVANGSSQYTFDAFNATNRVWQGKAEAPTSYNLFNEFTYFKNIGDSGKYLRVSHVDGYAVYSLNKAISIGIGWGKSAYVSYYLNGTYKTAYLSDANNYSISIGGNYNYNVSRIMVNTTNANLSYTPYVVVELGNYSEQYSGYKTQLDYKYYDTAYTFQAKITNINELINSDGSWNSGVDVKYSVVYNGVDRDGNITQPVQTFTYKNEDYPIEYTTTNGLKLKIDTTKTQVLRYVLNRRIIIETSGYNGNYYNITENVGMKDETYYHNNRYASEVKTNDKNSVKAKDGELISINSISGKLRLLQINNGGEFFGNYYVRRAGDGSLKLIQVNSKEYLQYYQYYDANKITTDGGNTFTYGDSGYELVNYDEDGNEYNDTSNFVYDIASLIADKNLTAETSNGTVLYGANVFEKVDTKNDLITISSKNNLNNYTVNSNVLDKMDETISFDGKTNLQFLLLATSTLDLRDRIIYTDSDGNHYKLYDASELIAPALSTTSNKVGVTLYDEYEVGGLWQRIDDLDAFVKNPLTSVSNKPVLASANIGGKVYFTYKYNEETKEYDYIGVQRDGDKITNATVYPYIDTIYLLDNLLIYRIKNDENIPSDYRGKYFTEKPGAYIKVEKNSSGENESVIKFDKTTNVDNLEDIPYVSDENFFEKLVDAYNGKTNVLNLYGDDKFAQANIYLSTTQNIPMYYFLKSEQYVLDYYADSIDAENFSQIDMRYQYSQIDEEISKAVRNGNTPVIIYGDDLSEDSLTKYNYYLLNDGEQLANDLTSPGTIEAFYRAKRLFKANHSMATVYNGVITDTAIKGGIKAGYVYGTVEKYDEINRKTYLQTIKVAEKIYYGGSVYYLGNFIDGTGNSAAGNDAFYRELAEYIELYYEAVLEKTIMNSLIVKEEDEKNGYGGFLNKISMTYADFREVIMKAKGLNENKANNIMQKFFNYDWQVKGVGALDNEYVPLIDLTSNFYNVTIDLLDLSVSVDYKEELISSRSKSKHYIQLGNYVYYRLEDERNNPITLDKITSYMGVDFEMDAGQGNKMDGGGEGAGTTTTTGAVALVAGVVLAPFSGGASLVLGASGIAMMTAGGLDFASALMLNMQCNYVKNLKSSSMATVAYSPLIANKENVNNTSPYINLQDILNSKNRELYFTEVISGSGEGRWTKTTNTLPFVNVHVVINDYGNHVIKYDVKGFKSFAFSGLDSESRFLLSDEPGKITVSQASSMGEWFQGGLDFSIPTEMTMYSSGNKTRFDLLQFDNETTNVVFNSTDSTGKTQSLVLNNGNTENISYPKFGLGVKDENGKEITLESTKNVTLNDATGDFNRYKIEDSLGGNYVVYGGITAAQMNLAVDDAAGVSFRNITTQFNLSHFGNWVGQTVVGAVSNAFKWVKNLFTEDDKRYNQIPSLATFNYRVISFYNFKYHEPIGYSDSFSVDFETQDADYTSNTSYKLTINDTTGLTEPSVYAYSLYYRPNDNSCAPGYVKKGDVCYFDDKNATSHIYESSTIKNVIQEKYAAESYSITNLPPKTSFYLRIYNAKTSNYTTQSLNYSIGTITSETGRPVINEPSDTSKYYIFTTSANLVNNPYGLKRMTVITDVSKTGNSYLKNNKYIDYDVAKFIFGQTSFNHPTLGFDNGANADYIFKYNELVPRTNDNGIVYFETVEKTLTFSGRYLAQKYLETENVSKITFGVVRKTTDNKNEDYLYGRSQMNAKVKIYSHKLGKYVLGDETKGVEMHSKDSYSGTFSYTLSENDKKILKEAYNNNVSNFVNGYLLNDNFEFRFNRLFIFGSGVTDADRIFNLAWQPYYENTMTYLNLNQSFELADGKPDYDKPTYDGDANLGFDAYDINGQKVTSEYGTYAKGNYPHLASTNSGLSNISTTAWNIGRISLTDTKGVYFSEYTELGVIATKNSSEYVPLCIITDGESHIYS